MDFDVCLTLKKWDTLRENPTQFARLFLERVSPAPKHLPSQQHLHFPLSTFHSIHNTHKMPRKQEIDLEDEEPPTVEPYKVLEIEKSATVDEVKSAYRKAALKHHPGMRITLQFGLEISLEAFGQGQLSSRYLVNMCYISLLMPHHRQSKPRNQRRRYPQIPRNRFRIRHPLGPHPAQTLRRDWFHGRVNWI